MRGEREGGREGDTSLIGNKDHHINPSLLRGKMERKEGERPLKTASRRGWMEGRTHPPGRGALAQRQAPEEELRGERGRKGILKVLFFL